MIYTQKISNMNEMLKKGKVGELVWSPGIRRQDKNHTRKIVLLRQVDLEMLINVLLFCQLQPNSNT